MSRLNQDTARGPEPTGRCRYCGDRLPKPMRWCDADCRNEWSALNE